MKTFIKLGLFKGSKTKSTNAQAVGMENSSKPEGLYKDTLALLRNNRLVQSLAGLLLVQLLLALALTWRTAGSESFAGTELLLDMSPNTINRISIEDDADSITLEKRNDTWHIKGGLNLTASSDQVNILLEKLSNLKLGLPVANTSNAREQLKVADDDFLRQLRISAADTEDATLLIGTSPGLRKSHVRREGQDNIYSGNLSMSELPVTVDNWMDKDILAFSDIEGISANGVSLRKVVSDSKETWELSEPTDDKRAVDIEKVKPLVKSLESLRVSGLFIENTNGVKNEGETTDEAILENTVVRIKSDSSDVELTLLKSGDSIKVTRDDIAGEFKLASWEYEKIVGLNALESMLVNSESEPDSKQQEE
ncbi:DUF4340 domain-containing protein [Granulosicoccus sp.]|nr:DUF4340 domain-containing protein [Granulosicoccus sp.]MDB4223379.1 DUF4340 domain-containing protein [Granulosicoccus sp.]